MAKEKAWTKEDAEKAAGPLTSPGAHDAPGLSPFERMLELTRRLVNVPPKELARERSEEEKKRGH